jgi:hypothetical protein
MEIVQSVTSNKKDIPQHFIPISSYGCHKGNSERKATREYKVLYRAWCDEQMSGIKFMANPHNKNGQIFVDPAEAKRVIEATIAPIPSPKVAVETKRANDLQYESACESLADIAQSLAGVERLLERLVDAAEAIATQPKTPQAELMHAIGSNGFHS